MITNPFTVAYVGKTLAVLEIVILFPSSSTADGRAYVEVRSM